MALATWHGPADQRLPAPVGMVSRVPRTRRAPRATRRSGGGCSHGQAGGLGALLPAFAGMFPPPRCHGGRCCAVPCICGGVPKWASNWKAGHPCILHPASCGDVPGHRISRKAEVDCFPRPRGCSLGPRVGSGGRSLLPALAGMIPSCHTRSEPRCSAPDLRGSSPAHPQCAAGVGLLPAPAGVFPRRSAGSKPATPAPALAGMFPAGWSRCTRRRTAPSTRGHVPEVQAKLTLGLDCSPHLRGVFPAETVRRARTATAPRTRADVSRPGPTGAVSPPCFLHSWGCSGHRHGEITGQQLLPAFVGCSREAAAHRHRVVLLFAPVGMLPGRAGCPGRCGPCFPLPRGCPRLVQRAHLPDLLFPAPARMLPGSHR